MVLLDDVHCTGFEDMLLNCSYASTGNHSCGHLDESHSIVVIQCKGVYSSNTQEAAVAPLLLTIHPQTWVNPPHAHTHIYEGKSFLPDMKNIIITYNPFALQLQLAADLQPRTEVDYRAQVIIALQLLFTHLPESKFCI